MSDIGTLFAKNYNSLRIYVHDLRIMFRSPPQRESLGQMWAFMVNFGSEQFERLCCPGLSVMYFDSTSDKQGPLFALMSALPKTEG